jgi:hypothetical protein
LIPGNFGCQVLKKRKRQFFQTRFPFTNQGLGAALIFGGTEFALVEVD